MNGVGYPSVRPSFLRHLRQAQGKQAQDKAGRRWALEWSAFGVRERTEGLRGTWSLKRPCRRECWWVSLLDPPYLSSWLGLLDLDVGDAGYFVEVADLEDHAA